LLEELNHAFRTLNFTPRDDAHWLSIAAILPTLAQVAETFDNNLNPFHKADKPEKYFATKLGEMLESRFYFAKPGSQTESATWNPEPQRKNGRIDLLISPPEPGALSVVVELKAQKKPFKTICQHHAGQSQQYTGPNTSKITIMFAAYWQPTPIDPSDRIAVFVPKTDSPGAKVMTICIGFRAALMPPSKLGKSAKPVKAKTFPKTRRGTRKLPSTK
jgi:hypothetical protein